MQGEEIRAAQAAFSLPDPRELNPLQLAYVGDTLHDLYVRSLLVSRKMSVGSMHKQAVRMVSAAAQAAMLAAMGGLGVTVQIVAFIAVSAAALAITRPLVKKFAAGKAVPTNLDRVLGETGKVMETVDNENSTGAVYVDGKTWTARSADGTVIPAGARVEIERMEGVKLFVKKYEEKAEVVL